MLLGTVIGVLVIPGLYYLFGRLADGRHLLRDEAGAPLSELFERHPLAPDTESDHALPAAPPHPETPAGEGDLPEAAEIPPAPEPPPDPPPPPGGAAT